MTTARITSAAAVLVAIMLAIAWLSGWFEQKIQPGAVLTGPQAQGGETTTVPVEMTSEAAIEWASGTIQSAHRTTIASRILARVVEVHVAAGDAVVEGDLLVVLDSRDLESRLLQAREALNAAKAQRELAQAELGRADELIPLARPPGRAEHQQQGDLSRRVT